MKDPMHPPAPPNACPVTSIRKPLDGRFPESKKPKAIALLRNSTLQGKTVKEYLQDVFLSQKETRQILGKLADCGYLHPKDIQQAATPLEIQYTLTKEGEALLAYLSDPQAEILREMTQGQA